MVFLRGIVGSKRSMGCATFVTRHALTTTLSRRRRMMRGNVTRFVREWLLICLVLAGVVVSASATSVTSAALGQGEEDKGYYFNEIEQELRHPTATWSTADEILQAPVWRGDDNKGIVYTPLFRGAFPGLEEYVYTPRSGDCTQAAHATIRMEWDQAANTVTTVIKGVHF